RSRPIQSAVVAPPFACEGGREVHSPPLSHPVDAKGEETRATPGFHTPFRRKGVATKSRGDALMPLDRTHPPLIGPNAPFVAVCLATGRQAMMIRRASSASTGAKP